MKPLKGTSSRFLTAASAALALWGVTSWSATAHADTMVIKNPGDHPHYKFEAEPHLLVGLFSPGPADGTGFGVGFRGAVPIVQNGFIPKLNNSVAIGFGADFLHFGHNDFNELYFPVVLQWNFFLSRNWSVFGEPGVGFNWHSGGDDHFDVNPFIFYAGGRFHFSDKIALTMRLGYPQFSVGVSFLL